MNAKPRTSVKEAKSKKLVWDNTFEFFISLSFQKNKRRNKNLKICFCVSLAKHISLLGGHQIPVRISHTSGEHVVKAQSLFGSGSVRDSLSLSLVYSPTSGTTIALLEKLLRVRFCDHENLNIKKPPIKEGMQILLPLGHMPLRVPPCLCGQVGRFINQSSCRVKVSALLAGCQMKLPEHNK